MKKFLVGALAAFVMAASPALAAEYPVYLGEELLTNAQAQDGVTFLPLRVVAEGLGYDVNYIPASRQIEISSDGMRLVFSIGSREMKMDYGYGSEVQEISAAPYAKAGVSYVPLRVVAENMDSAVFWQAEAKRVKILPRQHALISAGYDTWEMDWSITEDGAVYDLEDGRLLMQLDVPEGYAFEQCLDINHTKRGNWILSVWYVKEGADDKISHIWLNDETLAKNVLWTDGNEDGRDYVVVDGANVWLSSSDTLYCLDDTPGKVVAEFKLADLTGVSGQSLYMNGATAGKALLVQSDASRWWTVDVAGKVVEITDHLFTDEVKAEVNEQLYKYVRELPAAKKYATKEEFLATYWQNMIYKRYCNEYPTDPYLAVDSVWVGDGVVHLKLVVMTDGYNSRYSTEVSCEL